MGRRRAGKRAARRDGKGLLVFGCGERNRRAPTEVSAAQEGSGTVTSQHTATADVATAGSDVVDAQGRKAQIGSALGYAMDGFDLLILGFMLRVISADLHLTPAQGASLVTATLVGAV